MSDFNDSLREAFRLHQSGDMAAAGARYENLLAQAPDHAQLLYLCGTLRAQQSRLQDAAGLLQKAARLQPGLVDAHVNLGNVFYEMGDRAAAAAAWRDALDRQPGAMGALFGLGKVHLDNAAYPEAAQAFERVLQQAPGFFDGLMLLGDAYVRLNREQDALVQYEKALAIQPRHREAIMRLGFAVTVTGNAEKVELIRRLEDDHVYADAAAARAQAQRLAELCECPRAGIRERLAGLFREFDPSQVYSDAWWRDALAAFGVGGDPLDIYARSVFSSVYAWSIPSQGALDAVAAFSGGRRLNAPGAGTGYWEFLLARHHGNALHATDRKLRHRFVDMQRADYADAAVAPDDAVFLSWIPRGVDAAERVLEKMQPGQRLILVGEHRQDSEGVHTCATQRFYGLLEQDFRLVDRVPLVQFAQFSDSLRLYQRS